MPSLNATHQNRILVTGGNGFIGAHVVKLLLDRTAYQVVTTVRTAEKADKVIEIHGNNPHLTVEIVPDITAKDAFLVASADCDAVIHLASPFGYAYENFERELLIPSIDGAKAICYAANSISSVKRVIFASSFASVYDASPEGMSPSRVYTERDWSPLTYEDGKNALATPIAYRASKVLAEQEAWRLCMEQNRWDLVSLCPGMVLGALVDGSLGSLKDLNTSNALVWGLLDKDSVPDTKAPLWTSVISLAEGLLSALTAPKVGCERMLLINGYFDNQQLCDIIRSWTDFDSALKDRVPVGQPGQDIAGRFYKADWSKAERLLNFTKPTLEKTLLQLVKQLLCIEKATKAKIDDTKMNGFNGVS